MSIDGFDFSTVSSAQTDPDSPGDTILMTQLRDNIEFLQRWLGKSFLGGATADHDHDGVNSKKVTTANLAGDAGDIPGFDAAVQGVPGIGGDSMLNNLQDSGIAGATFIEIVFPLTDVADVVNAGAVLSIFGSVDEGIGDPKHSTIITFTRANADSTWAASGIVTPHETVSPAPAFTDGVNLSATSASFVNFDLGSVVRLQIKKDNDDQVTLRLAKQTGIAADFTLAVNGHTFA